MVGGDPSAGCDRTHIQDGVVETDGVHAENPFSRGTSLGGAIVTTGRDSMSRAQQRHDAGHRTDALRRTATRGAVRVSNVDLLHQELRRIYSTVRGVSDAVLATAANMCYSGGSVPSVLGRQQRDNLVVIAAALLYLALRAHRKSACIQAVCMMLAPSPTAGMARVFDSRFADGVMVPLAACADLAFARTIAGPAALATAQATTVRGADKFGVPPWATTKSVVGALEKLRILANPSREALLSSRGTKRSVNRSSALIEASLDRARQANSSLFHGLNLSFEDLRHDILRRLVSIAELNTPQQRALLSICTGVYSGMSKRARLGHDDYHRCGVVVYIVLRKLGVLSSAIDQTIARTCPTSLSTIAATANELCVAHSGLVERVWLSVTSLVDLSSCM